MMKTTRAILTVAAVWLMAATAGFAINPHLGTWKLNESKSSLLGAARNSSVTYTEGKGGMMTLTVDGSDKNGKPTHWTWEGKFDGKPYKVKGTDQMDAIAYTLVNDRTNKFIAVKGDKITATGTIEVAEDGKSRVVTARTTDMNGKEAPERSYYDKQ